MSITGIILTAAVILLVIWACCCLSLAFTDNYSDKYTLTEADDTLTASFFKASVFGDDFNITDTQINTFINNTLCEAADESDNRIENACIYFHENEPSELYARIKLYGYEFGIYAEAELSFDSYNSATEIKLSNARLGELEIPDFVLSYALSKIIGENEYACVSGTTIRITASYEYEIYSGYNINLTLKSLEVHDEYITASTNSLSEDVLALLRKYLSTDEGYEALNEIIGDSVDSLKDSIASWIKENISG